MTKKILIVDDDLESLKLIGLMLQRRGYETIVAHSGGQALELAQTEDPDLVILDIMMPDMDGYEVCERLRSNPDIPYLPVLMFTAKTLVGDKVAGYKAGADDYLTKPIHPSELVSHVEALLERAEQVRTPPKRPPRARVVGVLGAKGGVGASTLVVNLAAANGQHDAAVPGQDADRRVGVVDLRAGLGSVALQLGQVQRGGWASLVDRTSDRLDRETVEGQLVDHPSGLRYFPAALHPKNGPLSLPPDHVEAVLKRMTETVDALYLDLGCVLDEATRRAISRCDVLVVVVEPERLCLALAQALLDRIKSLENVPQGLHLVLLQRSETDAAYSQAEIETLLGYAVTAAIGPAAGVLRQALEQGDPVVLCRPESEIAKQFRDLSRALLA